MNITLTLTKEQNDRITYIVEQDKQQRRDRATMLAVIFDAGLKSREHMIDHSRKASDPTYQVARLKAKNADVLRAALADMLADMTSESRDAFVKSAAKVTK